MKQTTKEVLDKLTARAASEPQRTKAGYSLSLTISAMETIKNTCKDRNVPLSNLIDEVICQLAKDINDEKE